MHAVDSAVPAPLGTSAATVACRTAPGSRVALVTGVGGPLVASVRVQDGATTLATAADASHPGTTLWSEPRAIAATLEATCDYVNPTGDDALDRCGLGALVTGARGLSGCGP